jgi:hypothetical protein
VAQDGNRQKRKRRQRARHEPRPGSGDAAPAATNGESAVTRPTAAQRRQLKDDVARASLEPLAPGERPGAVTVAAVVAGLLALGNLVSYFAGAEVGGERPAFAGILVYSLLMLLVAWGLWQAKYWAVLGMMTLLALVLIVFGVLIVQAGNIGTLLICLTVLGLAGTLFYKLIRGMARIQMPAPPSARRRSE